MLLIDEENPDKIVCFDLEKGMVADEYYGMEGKDLRTITSEFKNAQRSEEQTFVGINN